MGVELGVQRTPKLGFWVKLVRQSKEGMGLGHKPQFSISIPLIARAKSPADAAYEEYRYLCRHFKNAELDFWSKDYIPHYVWLAARWAGSVTTETMEEFQALLIAEEVIERFERG